MTRSDEERHNCYRCRPKPTQKPMPKALTAYEELQGMKIIYDQLLTEQFPFKGFGATVHPGSCSNAQKTTMLKKMNTFARLIDSISKFIGGKEAVYC